MLVTGIAQGFSHTGVPSSAWRDRFATAPVGATGTGGATSLFNMQKRFPLPSGFMPQNVSVRAPSGWATNPMVSRSPVTHPGNGFSGGQSA